MKNAINFYFLNFSQTSAIQDWVQLRWLGNFRCHAGIQAWYKYWLQNSLLPNYMLIIIGDKPHHERNTLTIFYVKWAQINILWTKSNFSENFLTEVLLLKVIWFRNVFFCVFDFLRKTNERIRRYCYHTAGWDTIFSYTVRPRDTRPWAARTSQVHVFNWVQKKKLRWTNLWSENLQQHGFLIILPSPY